MRFYGYDLEAVLAIEAQIFFILYEEINYIRDEEILKIFDLFLCGNSSLSGDAVKEIKRNYINGRIQKQQADYEEAKGITENKFNFAKLKALQKRK